MARDFTGHIAVVTGAATGIGAATARLLATGGAAVGLVGLQPVRLHRLAAELAGTGARSVAIEADVSDPDEVAEAVQRVADSFGGLHLAANCAAVTGAQALLHEVPVADWRQTLSVNLDGVFYAMRAELTHLLACGGGAIVNVASVNATAPLGQRAAYTTSKFGIVGLSKSTALDYAARRVRVNVISPGVTDTPMTAGGGDTAELMKSIVPMRRMATPEEIARVITFALSADASYMTGAEIIVDGAFVLRTAAVLDAAVRSREHADTITVPAGHPSAARRPRAAPRP
jgi:NAD(P)-dependent dehydrogenase (short-subunit alcohol dehydrogenase family)